MIMNIKFNDELGIKVSPKQNQKWKTDIYVGVSGNVLLKEHAHFVASGAVIISGGFVQGDFYYYRDITQNRLIDRRDDGSSII